MTPESIVSVVCEAFSCTPDIALDQDPELVFAILEVRAAKQGLEYVRSDISKMPPEMVKFWREFTEGDQ
jgi:hypothetical protein|tara:strand:+ start:8880 stop:9086 length:207 start_codon:yes stop_codon:yes gene_type:complete